MASRDDTRLLRPYGLWDSPITPRMLAQGMRLNDVQWTEDGRTLVWLEGRSGHNILVAQTDDDAAQDVILEHSPRGGLAYGGGEFTLKGDALFFVQQGRVYRLSLSGGLPRAITPQFGALASPAVSPDGRWVVYAYSYEDVDGLAIVDSEGVQWPQRLVWGADFYMTPVWHPSGEYLAWLEWDHPHMPWDGTRLYLARVEETPPRIKQRTFIAGGDDVPVFQPAFSPDGRYLSYIVTEDEWDTLVLYEVNTGEFRTLLEGDGLVLAAPAWIHGLRTYGWTGDGRFIYVRQNDRGFAKLLRVHVETGRV